MLNGHVSMEVVSGNTDTPKITEMYYVSFGTGEKKAVILPGLSDGLMTVKDKAWFLSLPYRSFLQDYTVFMFSRKNDMPEGYSIEAMADDQAAAMRRLGIDRSFVLGVSEGGMIAQCLAIRHPDLVDRMVLAVTAPNANDIINAVVSEWMEKAASGNHEALMADTAEKMYSDTYLTKSRKFLPLLARVTKPADYDRFLKNARAILNFDVRGELSKISCPTLIIAGGDDHVVGKEAAIELHKGITGSRLYVYDGLGHGAYEEAKDFYDRVFAFFSCR